MESQRKGILFVSHEVDIHGASKMLLQLIDSFQNNYKIYVLIPDEGAIVDELRKRQCTIIVKKFHLSVEPFYGDLRSKFCWPIRKLRYFFARRKTNQNIANEMVSFVKQHNITLIHSNSSSITIGLDIALKAGVKHIWHFREFLEEDFKLRPLMGWHDFIYQASMSDAIVCVSNAIYNKYVKLINAPVYMVYDGIPDIEMEKYKTVHKQVNLFQAGVLSKGKGTDVAISALRYLLEIGYHDIELFLAGNGDLTFCQESYSKIKDHVHLLGYVKDVDSCKIENNIDIELVCSVSEGFGLVSVEAMRSKNPVIGSNSAGTAEIVCDGYNGLLFEPGNARDLAKKIEFFINNTDKIKEYGINGYRRYKELFTSDKNANGIKRIYDSLIGGDMDVQD